MARVLAGAWRAEAGPVLDRIRHDGVVRCGGVARPGLFAIEDKGKASGLELEICRAITSVILGPNGRLEFRSYDSLKAFDSARDGADDLSFLTARELIENGLTDKMIPGPPIFIESSAVMVADEAPYQHVAELAEKPICFALLGRAQSHLSAWFDTRHLSFVRMGFQEDVEMNDAYNVHYCHGLAGEITTLAETRADAKGAKSAHRLLPELLASYPILAATSVRDGEWAAVVAWTIHSLMRADAPSSQWTTGGLDSLPIPGTGLGLPDGWQKRMVQLVGGYAQMYERTLGMESELKLPRGLNASLMDGGAMATPFSE